MAEAMLVTVEKKVEAKINARKAGTQYVVNDFTVLRSALPIQLIEDLPKEGLAYIIGLGPDEQGVLTRTNAAETLLPVQVGFIKAVVADDTQTIDNLKLLTEQLLETVRKDVDPEINWASWQRSEWLKGENGTPFSFMGLREGSFFEVHFAAFYKVAVA
jgi:hypothetical protein